MSISLCLHWDDGHDEDMIISGQYAAEGRWLDIAHDAGLKQYNGVFPMFLSRTNLDEVIADFERIYDNVGRPSSDRIDRLGGLIARLKQLKNERGWQGYIG